MKSSSGLNGGEYTLPIQSAVLAIIMLYKKLWWDGRGTRVRQTARKEEKETNKESKKRHSQQDDLKDPIAQVSRIELRASPNRTRPKNSIGFLDSPHREKNHRALHYCWQLKTGYKWEWLCGTGTESLGPLLRSISSYNKGLVPLVLFCFGRELSIPMSFFGPCCCFSLSSLSQSGRIVCWTTREKYYLP